VKIYVAAVEALRQKKTQFTTKIDGFLSFIPSWMPMYFLAVLKKKITLCMTKLRFTLSTTLICSQIWQNHFLDDLLHWVHYKILKERNIVHNPSKFQKYGGYGVVGKAYKDNLSLSDCRSSFRFWIKDGKFHSFIKVQQLWCSLLTFIGCMELLFLILACHYFWPELNLIALPKNNPSTYSFLVSFPIFHSFISIMPKGFELESWTPQITIHDPSFKTKWVLLIPFHINPKP
jgi:hypothetical protein